MRKLMLAMGCAAMVVPATMVVPVSQAGAQRYKYREWRDNRGRLRCRKPDGTTGAVVGAVGQTIASTELKAVSKSFRNNLRTFWALR